MNKTQDKIIELLKETDALCRGSGAGYWLSGDTLLYGFCTQMPFPDAHSGEIIMTDESFALFESSFRSAQMDKRELIRKHSRALYIASDTTAFNMLESDIQEPCGMYIEISILKKEKTAKGICPSYSLEFRTKTIEGISGNYLTGSNTCSLGAFCFPAPAYTFTFLKKLYGRNPVEGENGLVIEGYTPDIKYWITDPVLPYKEFAEKMSFTADDRARLLKEKEAVVSYKEASKADRKLAREDWRTVQQTDARVRLWKHYLPLKDEMIRLHAEGDYDALEEMFDAYSRELKKLKTWKRSVAFDNTLLNIYIDLLEHRRSFEEAERILKQLPASHLEVFDPNGVL